MPDGLAWVEPSTIQPGTQRVGTCIEEVRVNNRSVPVVTHHQETGRLRFADLGTGPQQVEIRYTAFDYQAASQLRFRYQLEGHDHGWIESGTRRTAFYSRIAPEVRKLGLQILDLPAAVAVFCGKAYRRYLLARRASGGRSGPKTPLPDFFVGTHAEVLNYKLATRDADRIKTYFPKVIILAPTRLPKY